MRETLEKLFVEQFDHPFIKADDRWITYGEYLTAAGALGDRLASAGASGAVCVISRSTLTYFVVFFACLLQGLRYIPLDSNKGKEDRRQELACAAPRWVVADSAEDAQGFPVLDVDVRKLLDARADRQCLCRLSDVNMDAEFLVTFTSGTTSNPKGVVHSFSNLMGSARALGDLFRFDGSSVFFHNFPPSYMAGVLNQFVVPMVCGSRVVIGDRFSVQAALRFWVRAIDNGVNAFWMSPTMLRMLLTVDRGSKGKQYCAKVRPTIIAATAPLSVSLRKEFEVAYQVPIFESFGLTETLFNASNHPGMPVVDGCAGYVLPGTSISLGEDGEMVLSCRWMFLRYMHEPQGSPVRSEFPTGDIAIVRDNGLFITGRKKDLIIRGGMNASPGKIERELDGRIVGEFAVVGQEDPLMGEKPCWHIPHSNRFPRRSRSRCVGICQRFWGRTM